MRFIDLNNQGKAKTQAQMKATHSHNGKWPYPQIFRDNHVPHNTANTTPTIHSRRLTPIL
jgi:hypothetical protein